MMKKNFGVLLFVLFLSFFASTQKVGAVDCTSPPGYNCVGGCTREGQCGPNNQFCVEVGRNTIAPNGGTCGSGVVGGIAPPQGVGNYNCSTGNCATGIGIFAFVSVGLRFFTIICGLFILFNFLFAGYTLITSAGDTGKYSDVRDRLTYALIGLVIIVAAYMAAAMFGLWFFGDAGFILNPDISEYGAIAP